MRNTKAFMTGLACAVLALLTSSALGAVQTGKEDSNYFKIEGGVAQPMDLEFQNTGLLETELSLKPGVRVNLVGGYKIDQNLAFELEAGAVYNEADTLKIGPFETDADMDLWQVPVMANLTYRLFPQSVIQPYIGAGAGGVFTIVDTDDMTDYDFTFGYQGIAGIDFQLGDGFKLGLAYKFLGTLEHEFDGIETDAIYTHAVLGVLTFRF